VAPEKAIKLTVNDIVRAAAMDPETGRIKIGWELAAGGMAGGCQVVRECCSRFNTMLNSLIGFYKSFGDCVWPYSLELLAADLVPQKNSFAGPR
jgi:hypothetical protein